MTLELTPVETQELRDSLGSYLSELRTEIVHTDSYDYRQGLKARKAVLGGLLARLDADAATGSQSS
jgi:hypothetical protein